MSGRDFESIYAAHSKLVYWTAFGVLKEQEAALDAAQNVFLRVFQHGKNLEKMNDAQLRAWLYRVATNAALDLLRRSKRVLPTEDVAMDLAVDEAELPESVLMDKESRDTVRECVNQLPKLYREPVTLYYFSNLSYLEIAELLEVSEGTVKSRMSRARGMLSHMLMKGGEKVG